MLAEKANSRAEFSEEDMKVLLDHGKLIHSIASEDVADTWKAFASEHDVSIEFHNLIQLGINNHVIGTTTHRKTVARFLGENCTSDILKESR